MDWRLLASAFGLVFLAELGDKTQLATMMLAARAESPVNVFLGAMLAMLVNVSLAVIVGSVLVRVIPEDYIRYGAGLLFFVLGGLMLLGRW